MVAKRTLVVVLVMCLMQQRHMAVHRLGVGQTSLWRSVGYALVLNLEPLVADLEAIHLFDSELGAHDGVVRDKSESLGLASVPIHEDFGADDIAEGVECRGEVGIR